MSPAVDIVPIVIVPLSFLFVLLIILIVKAPKTGACIVGGLILLAPLALLALAKSGLPAHPDAGALIVVPAAFLFVLLIILLTKAPKAGAALIVMLLILGLFSLFFFGRISHRPTAMARIEMHGPSAMTLELPSVPTPSIPTPPVAVPAVSVPPAPIWSAGVDTELEADIYPSVFAATGAASAKLGRSIRELAPDANALPKVTVLQQDHPYRLIAELRDAIRRALPEVSCDIESEYRPPRAGELIVTLSQRQLTVRSAPWIKLAPANPTAAELHVGEPSTVWMATGQVDIHLSGRGAMTIPLHFTDKPWMEDFATFAGTRPEQAFIIARSLGTCTSEGEANQQALNDACARLTEVIGRQSGSKLGPSAPPITPTDVLQGRFIVDRFAQSLEGSAARIWRQALLLDVSGPKLAQLANQKAREFRQVKTTWARMGLSAVGVVVLIGVIYFFLNMATMGYYEWSLRIASVVLAVVGVLSILMVVH